MISPTYEHLQITLPDGESVPVADIFDNDEELLHYAYVVNDGEDLTVIFQ